MFWNNRSHVSPRVLEKNTVDITLQPDYLPQTISKKIIDFMKSVSVPSKNTVFDKTVKKIFVKSSKYRYIIFFSEALILASVNPQHKKRLFIEFPKKYKVTTCCVQKLFCFCVLHSKQFLYTACSDAVFFLYWTICGQIMN